MNRLKLDFSLSSVDERLNFLNTYLQNISFQPTAAESETIADYILWGKGAIQEDCPIELESKHGTWDKKAPESLDALQEQEGYNEINLKPITKPATKIAKLVFSRSEARERAIPELLNKYELLWQQIDQIELEINYYDLLHNKRKTEPRAILVNKFTDDEQHILYEKAKALNQYSYLKLRHLLVELRREQFTLRDTWAEPILKNDQTYWEEERTLTTSDVAVLPIGALINHNQDNLITASNEEMRTSTLTQLDCTVFSNSKAMWLSKFMFQSFAELSECGLTQSYPNSPYNFNDLAMTALNRVYNPTKATLTFDFRNPEHVFQLITFNQELDVDLDKVDIENNVQQLLDTLDYYITHTNLTDVQRRLLFLKISHKRNMDIAGVINAEFGKSYTDNYISTIFRQKIIPAICETAAYHYDIISNIGIPEAFKKCTTCGRSYLRTDHNFVHKARSQDGFSNQCKFCDKAIRKSKGAKK